MYYNKIVNFVIVLMLMQNLKAGAGITDHVHLNTLMCGLKGWKADMLFDIPSASEDEPDTINICKIMDSDKPYTFPSLYNGIDNKTKLLMDLKICAMKTGFALVHRSTVGNKQLEKLNKHAYITLQCQHGIKFHGKEKRALMSARLNIVLHQVNYVIFVLISHCAR